MTIPQKTYKTISADKIIINLVIHQENQTQILLKKLNLQENWKKMMVEQGPLSLKSKKKLFLTFL